MKNRELGNQGEQIAIDYLKEHGYLILDKNFQKQVGEIDIIALDTRYDEYVFVEVKTRYSDKFGYPEDSVSKKKLQKIISTANLWIGLQEKERAWRVDIIAIEIIGGKINIEHIENIG